MTGWVFENVQLAAASAFLRSENVVSAHVCSEFIYMRGVATEPEFLTNLVKKLAEHKHLTGVTAWVLVLTLPKKSQLIMYSKNINQCRWNIYCII